MNAENALVLVNLGTPASPSTRDVRHFLKVFLSDPRVVKLPRLLWLPLLYGIILPLRSARVAELYRQIWWRDGSPLKVITERQTRKLAVLLRDEKLDDEKQPSPVRYAMVYGKPALATVIQDLKLNGTKTITVLPLYPQYCSATTGAVEDQLHDLQKRFATDITITMVKAYYDDTQYIKALAESVQQHRQQHNKGEFLLFSFHGVPQSLIDGGDPYYQQCLATATQVAQQLQLPPERWQVAFQSRFGKAEWVKPYTDLVIRELAQKGIKQLDVITPAFASDCLETLEEIAVRNAAAFQQAGGEQLRLIPCLNDNDAHIMMMKKLFEKNSR